MFCEPGQCGESYERASSASLRAGCLALPLTSPIQRGPLAFYGVNHTYPVPFAYLPIEEGTKVSRETEHVPGGVALPMTEMRALKELVTLQDSSPHVLSLPAPRQDCSALYSGSLMLVVSAGCAAAGGTARTHYKTSANCRRQ